MSYASEQAVLNAQWNAAALQGEAASAAHDAAVADRSRAIEAQEFNLIALLKPSISIDGNQWCVLYGDNLQDGVAGFGDSPYLAVLEFNKAWHVAIRTAPLSVTKGVVE